MKMIDSKELEDCLDGVAMREIRVDAPIGSDDIYRLSGEGRLEYFKHFPRPFYRISESGRFMIKGVEGSQTFQVIFYTRAVDEAEGVIRQRLEGA